MEQLSFLCGDQNPYARVRCGLLQDHASDHQGYTQSHSVTWSKKVDIQLLLDRLEDDIKRTRQLLGELSSDYYCDSCGVSVEEGRNKICFGNGEWEGTHIWIRD